MLSTGDIRDWDAVVDQILRCLVLKAPVNRREHGATARVRVTAVKTSVRQLLSARSELKGVVGDGDSHDTS